MGDVLKGPLVRGVEEGVERGPFVMLPGVRAASNCWYNLHCLLRYNFWSL